MKSNKGFTLIELLAVIVILAIIALIATPIILSVIDTAKKGSAEASALAYVKAVEDQVVIGQVTTDTADNITYPANDLKVTDVGDKVKVKGAAPTDGTLTLDADGEISNACLVITLEGTSYNVKYDSTNNKAQVQTDSCATATE